jgi:tetratricopeptide (TPR) repeat protein
MWAAGFACVFWVTLIGGSYSGIRYRIASNRLQQAESLLQYNYRIAAEETPRLAGGYKSGIGLVMGDSIHPYLREASSLANSAFNSGWKSDQARQLLAKVFIINQQYDRADSIFKLIKSDAAKSAEVLNDLGVLNYEQRNWESAANYFASAIQADAQFREALYNLALTKEKLGADAEALRILDEYLKLETDETWIDATREFQKRLKAKR